MRNDDDNGGRKPYKRYKAGRGSRGGRATTHARSPRSAQMVSTGVTGRRRRFRWWFVPVGLLVALIIAGVVVTVLAWPGYQKFDRAVDKSNKRIDKKTRAQLTADDGWILSLIHISEPTRLG